MGIAGNEMADVLAKQGLENPRFCYRAATSLGHLKRLVKKDIVKLWQERWSSQEIAEERGRRNTGMSRLYRLISKDSLTFSLRPKSSIINLSKNTISAYIQLKTGKGLLKSFQHAIHKAPDNKCFCQAGKRQDTRHLLLECEEYRVERAEMRKQLKNIPLQLNVLFCTSRGQNALAWFLQKTNICTVGWYTSKEG